MYAIFSETRFVTSILGLLPNCLSRQSLSIRSAGAAFVFQAGTFCKLLDDVQNGFVTVMLDETLCLFSASI